MDILPRLSIDIFFHFRPPTRPFFLIFQVFTNMCVYEPEIHADGRFTLNEKQIMELKKKGYHFSQIYSALMKIYTSQGVLPPADLFVPVAEKKIYLLPEPVEFVSFAGKVRVAVDYFHFIFFA